MIHTGLGGSKRLESDEYHADLDKAFNAGRDRAISGQSPDLKGIIPQYLRTEYMAGYRSIKPDWKGSKKK